MGVPDGIGPDRGEVVDQGPAVADGRAGVSDVVTMSIRTRKGNPVRCIGFMMVLPDESPTLAASRWLLEGAIGPSDLGHSWLSIG
jgi:hypothetical protein